MEFMGCKTSTLWRCLFMLVLLTCVFRTAAPGQNPKLEKASSPQKPAAVTGFSLDVILEGPFAICTSVPGKPGKFKILVPRVGGHFAPGFDSDLSDFALCEGDFSLNLGAGHSPGPGQIPQPTGPTDPIFDNANLTTCPRSDGRFLSLLVDSPDKVFVASSAKATVTGSSVSGEQLYVTRTVLSYNGVDLSNIKVSRDSGTACKLDVLFKDPLKFIPSTTEGHLVFSMTPSERDDDTHTDSKAAYKELADTLGLQRTVNFPPSAARSSLEKTSPGISIIGTHDDCRAPQILVTP